MFPSTVQPTLSQRVPWLFKHQWPCYFSNVSQPRTAPSLKYLAPSFPPHRRTPFLVFFLLHQASSLPRSITLRFTPLPFYISPRTSPKSGMSHPYASTLSIPTCWGVLGTCTTTPIKAYQAHLLPSLSWILLVSWLLSHFPPICTPHLHGPLGVTDCSR